MIEKNSDNPWTILIVDDENVIRRLLCHKLKSEGYVCIEADSPQQAMEKMHEQPVDIVILDIMMPGGSGIELLPDIKNTPSSHHSSKTVGDADTAIKCVRLGAYDLASPNLDEVAISVIGL